MIVQEGDPRLRKDTRRVEPDEIGGTPLRELIETMWRELRRPSGVGLAAPQIGDERAVAVVEDTPAYVESISPELRIERQRQPVEPYVLINPEARPVGSETALFFEGCLSVPDRAGVVERALTVRVAWTDETGKRHEETVTGWHARIVQHEVDHLNGVLFVDRADPHGFVSKDAYFDEWRFASAGKIHDLLVSRRA